MHPLSIYRELRAEFGAQHWWPVHHGERRKGCDATFEILVGCILTQNTAWRNVEKAISAMYDANCLDVPSLLATSAEVVRSMIRPAGYFNQKEKKLRILASLIENMFSNENTFSLPQRFISTIPRADLLGVWGIGPETADSMLLYAGNRPEFVIDLYTKRLCATRGVTFDSYDEYKAFFTNALPVDATLYNEFHALIVAWGKVHSRDFRGTKR